MQIAKVFNAAKCVCIKCDNWICMVKPIRKCTAESCKDGDIISAHLLCISNYCSPRQKITVQTGEP